MATPPDESQQIQSQLDDVNYEMRDYDLLRYLDSDVDEAMRGVVETLKSMSPAQRAAVVTQDSDVGYMLQVYGERRTLYALRQNSLTTALEAFDARLVSSRSSFELWRRDTLFSAYVAMSLGALAESLLSASARLAHTDRDEAIANIVDNVERIDDLNDVGRLGVSTHYGLGILDIQIERHEPLRGILSVYPTSPILTKSKEQFIDSHVPLAKIAVALADEVETISGVLAHDIRLYEFPVDAMRNAGLRMDVDVTTCMSLMLFNIDSAQDDFEVFVAELADETQVTELIDWVSQSTEASEFIAVCGSEAFIALLFAVPDLGMASDEALDPSEFDGDELSERENDGSGLFEQIDEGTDRGHLTPSPRLTAYFACVQRALAPAVRAALRG